MSSANGKRYGYDVACKDCGRSTLGRFGDSEPGRCWACEDRHARQDNIGKAERAHARLGGGDLIALRDPETRAMALRAQREQRRKRVLSLRQQGATFPAIAAELGISVERARQLVHQAARATRLDERIAAARAARGEATLDDAATG